MQELIQKLTYTELRTYIRILHTRLPSIPYDDVVWISILRQQGEFNKTPAAQISDIYRTTAG